MSEGQRPRRPGPGAPRPAPPGTGLSSPLFLRVVAGWWRGEGRGRWRTPDDRVGRRRLRFCARSLGGRRSDSSPPGRPVRGSEGGAGPARRAQLLCLLPGAAGCVSQRSAAGVRQHLPVRPTAADPSAPGRATPAASATQSPCLLSSRGGCVPPRPAPRPPACRCPPNNTHLDGEGALCGGGGVRKRGKRVLER